MILSLNLVFLVGCQKTDYSVEKSKTQYRHRQEELIISYQQDGVTFDSFTEKAILRKIAHVGRGKFSTHFTLPKFAGNTENSIRMEQLKNFLMKKGVKKNELHFDENLKQAEPAHKTTIKVDYYEVIPPRCDKYEYVDPGNHRCAFDNNMAMMIADPSVFFNSESTVSSHASDGIEAIKAHDKEWAPKEDNKTASSLTSSVNSLIKPGEDK